MQIGLSILKKIFCEKLQKNSIFLKAILPLAPLIIFIYILWHLALNMFSYWCSKHQHKFNDMWIKLSNGCAMFEPWISQTYVFKKNWRLHNWIEIVFFRKSFTCFLVSNYFVWMHKNALIKHMSKWAFNFSLRTLWLTIEMAQELLKNKF